MSSSQPPKSPKPEELPIGVGTVPQWWMEVTPHYVLDLEEEEARALVEEQMAYYFSQLALAEDMNSLFDADGNLKLGPDGQPLAWSSSAWTGRSANGGNGNGGGGGGGGGARNFRIDPQVLTWFGVDETDPDYQSYLTGAKLPPGFLEKLHEMYGADGIPNNMHQTDYGRYGRQAERPAFAPTWVKKKLRSTTAGQNIRKGAYNDSPNKHLYRRRVDTGEESTYQAPQNSRSMDSMDSSGGMAAPTPDRPKRNIPPTHPPARQSPVPTAPRTAPTPPVQQPPAAALRHVEAGEPSAYHVQQHSRNMDSWENSGGMVAASMGAAERPKWTRPPTHPPATQSPAPTPGRAAPTAPAPPVQQAPAPVPRAAPPAPTPPPAAPAPPAPAQPPRVITAAAPAPAQTPPRSVPQSASTPFGTPAEYEYQQSHRQQQMVLSEPVTVISYPRQEQHPEQSHNPYGYDEYPDHQAHPDDGDYEEYEEEIIEEYDEDEEILEDSGDDADLEDLQAILAAKQAELARLQAQL